MTTRNIVGAIPEPDELYGRVEFIRHLWRRLPDNNILLLAPRRFGKSGVMHHVLKKPDPGYLPLYFDLEDVDSPAEFLWRVSREILSHDRLRAVVHDTKALPRTLFDFVKDSVDELGVSGGKVKFKNSVAENWKTRAKKLLAEMEKADERLVFIFDELPDMLERLTDAGDESVARDFMSWFRSVRIHDRDKLRRHRFVVGGSIGIDLILRRINSQDKLNDFERLFVEPIEEAAARKLVRDLARALEVEMSAELVGAGLDLVGPRVPYFTHMLMGQLGQLPPADRQPLSRATLERVYRQRILGPSCRHYFDHYQHRLRRYGKPLERGAKAVLKAVAESERLSDSALYDVYRKARKSGASDQEFRELMADLECEWYLVLDPTTNEYHFMVDTMRDWWKRWYGAKPARESPKKRPKKRSKRSTAES